MRFLLAMCVALTIGVAAKGQQGSFQSSGAATETCGRWTAERRANSVRSWVDEHWILGFLSGVAYEGRNNGIDPLTGVDNDAVWAWIDNYCREKPLAMLIVAAIAFRDAHPHG